MLYPHAVSYIKQEPPSEQMEVLVSQLQLDIQDII